MARSGDGRWLSLGRACEILGVNETTLRHWANTGRIRAFRTPGGHRRFPREDLNDLTVAAPIKVAGATPEGAHAPTALERIRRRIGRQKGRNDGWLQYFDDDGRACMRVLGRRLVTLTTEYVGRHRRRAELQEEARHLGVDYGRELATRNVGLTEAISAFIFFRNFLHGSVGQDPERAPEIRMMLDLEDVVLLGMATVYEHGLAASNGSLAAPVQRIN